MKSKITPGPRLVEALPWMMFFRDGKSLGQIAELCGGRIEDYRELTDKLQRLSQELLTAERMKTKSC